MLESELALKLNVSLDCYINIYDIARTYISENRCTVGKVQFI